MEAIELLEGVEIVSMSEPLPLAASIVLGILCFVAIGLGIYLLADSIASSFGGGILLSLLFICIGVGLMAIVVNETLHPTPSYKVTVDDSVFMNEFYEKYEVLNVDGKIYTIEERK